VSRLRHISRSPTKEALKIAAHLTKGIEPMHGKILGLLAVALLSGPAVANARADSGLISDGGFEQPSVGTGGLKPCLSKKN
jgi:hypothetical protein